MCFAFFSWMYNCIIIVQLWTGGSRNFWNGGLGGLYTVQTFEAISVDEVCCRLGLVGRCGLISSWKCFSDFTQWKAILSVCVRLATSWLRKCESERFSRWRKWGTKSQVNLFCLQNIEFDLHIGGAKKNGCDVNIWQPAPPRKMTSQYRPLSDWILPLTHPRHTADQKTGRLKMAWCKREKSISHQTTLLPNLAETGFEKVYICVGITSIYIWSGVYLTSQAKTQT